MFEVFPMKYLRVVGKTIAFLIVLIVVLCSGIFLVYNESMPESEISEEADFLALKMLQAVNNEAYKNTRFLEWTFKGRNHYLWDKKEGIVTVSWKDYVVQLDLLKAKNSIVLRNGEQLHDSKKEEFIKKAMAYFNNDSFWLVAPHKVFDAGTERRLVTLENGKEALLVTYTTGGNTPGDSYLWLLDDSGLPRAYKMWVSIIPIGGLEAKWKTWKTMESGALLPTEHSLLFLEMDMGFVRAWN
ncbi:hypothetical protein [Eudoraea chungangensis]|uniref:hypothetical protein n=1 Tax=Eudoraea chungangensis TaxID=1481905 RepID=UPI0023ED427B|nr:hypothetical protein [Eudoraea chungangensis]